MELWLLFVIIYVSGFVVTLILLHITNGLFGHYNHYDPPHFGYYDDWDSNSEAYLGFSAVWFVFYHLTL